MLSNILNSHSEYNSLYRNTMYVVTKLVETIYTMFSMLYNILHKLAFSYYGEKLASYMPCNKVISPGIYHLNPVPTTFCKGPVTCQWPAIDWCARSRKFGAIGHDWILDSLISNASKYFYLGLFWVQDLNQSRCGFTGKIDTLSFDKFNLVQIRLEQGTVPISIALYINVTFFLITWGFPTCLSTVRQCELYLICK